jgi:hypothetical protein
MVGRNKRLFLGSVSSSDPERLLAVIGVHVPVRRSSSFDSRAQG